LSEGNESLRNEINRNSHEDDVVGIEVEDKGDDVDHGKLNIKMYSRMKVDQ
jgi:hypothetical protein